jgi:hypothetical protein
MIVLGIDPGTTKSAFIFWDTETKRILSMDHVLNKELIDSFERIDVERRETLRVAIEGVECFGQTIGKDTIETIKWIGKFHWELGSEGIRYEEVFRTDIKLHFCNSRSAKGKNIRQAIIDRFGGDRIAKGGIKCKKCKGKGWFGAGRAVCPVCNGDKWEVKKGVLHGVSNHVWSALAVALFYADTV